MDGLKELPGYMELSSAGSDIMETSRYIIENAFRVSLKTHGINTPIQVKIDGKGMCDILSTIHFRDPVKSQILH